jgi:uncharacterized protein (DUF302 family)
MDSHLTKVIDGDFESIIEKMNKLLVAEGFVILTQYDVKKGLENEWESTLRRYHILSACNTDMAKQVMKTKEMTGVMLPFTIVIEENANAGIKVSSIGPISSMLLNRDQSLDLGTIHVRIKLNKIIRNL